MPPKTQIKIFISCPEDVEKEKLIAIEELKKLAKIFSNRFVFEIVEWKQNTVSLITGEGAQSVINYQIGDDYDICIGILWSYFGLRQANGLTPTEEEFERALSRYKKTKKPLISVYFKTDDSQSNDTEQILAVKKFKEKIKPLGLYHAFKECEFKDEIVHDIGYKIENWFHINEHPTGKTQRRKQKLSSQKSCFNKRIQFFWLIFTE